MFQLSQSVRGIVQLCLQTHNVRLGFKLLSLQVFATLAKLVGFDSNVLLQIGPDDVIQVFFRVSECFFILLSVILVNAMPCAWVELVVEIGVSDEFHVGGLKEADLVDEVLMTVPDVDKQQLLACIEFGFAHRKVFEVEVCPCYV